MLLIFLRALGRRWWRKWAQTKGGDDKKGPNDTGCVIWAISKFSWWQDSNENISCLTVMEQPPIMCHTSRCSSKIIRAGKRHTSKSVISLLPTGNNVTDAPLTGNSYNIYKQDISEIDMYTHHPWWVNYIDSLLGWQLGPDEYITSPIWVRFLRSHTWPTNPLFSHHTPQTHKYLFSQPAT